MLPKTKGIYWLTGFIVVVIAVVWLDHEPTASINSLESLETQKAKLTSQMSAVFDEEGRLVKNSLRLNEELPYELVAPRLPSNTNTELGNRLYSNVQNTDHKKLQSSFRSSSTSDAPTSPEMMPELSQSSEQSRTHMASARMELVFDLNYLLTPATISSATQQKDSQLKLSHQTEHWTSVNIKSGDSLTAIFKRIDVDPRLAVAIARQNGAEILNSLRLGPHLAILRKGEEFQELRYQVDLLTILSVARTSREYQVKTIHREFDVAEKGINGVIKSSLFESGIDEGISLELLYNLSSIFQWRIDFSRDLRPGDQYSLIFQERSLDGKKFSSGPILAAKLVVDGKTYQAIRHVSDTGRTHYFTPDGESLEGLFLRSPMRISRVTSPFSTNRYHPILKTWRSHKGVDYGGAVGDPVMATADGVISFAGFKGHYGRAIIIQHGKKYSTLYAHLSRFSKHIRSGRTVTQGQIIGYVGASGLATGSHLHYEFRVNGIHKNPLTVKLPRSFAIDRQARATFLESAQLWSKRLDQLTSG
jgi:murein DD-endopeptidase MepM/ murein hydrolase activator NlpD